MKRWLLGFSFIAIVLAIVLALSISRSRAAVANKKAELGESVVKLLYEFNSAEQLDHQMNALSKLVTEPIYNQLTIDNEDRTLSTYFKFKGKPVLVNIIKSTESYVLYSLETENVDSNRIFIFMFDVNDGGKIDFVREVEAIDFVKVYN